MAPLGIPLGGKARTTPRTGRQNAALGDGKGRQDGRKCLPSHTETRRRGVVFSTRAAIGGGSRLLPEVLQRRWDTDGLPGRPRGLGWTSSILTPTRGGWPGDRRAQPSL